MDKNMRTFLWAALVLLSAGLVLLAIGILLTARGKPATDYSYWGPNRPALLSLLLGSLALWVGCIGMAVVLRRSSVVLAGFLTVAASFLLPSSLHAIGVTWWSYYSTIPALALLLAGCIQLAAAAVRITMLGASRIIQAVPHRLPPRALPPYLNSVLIGLVLGLLVYFWLARWYEPPLTSSFTVPLAADFEWDSADGVTAFRLRDSATKARVWARAREFLVGVQIKPQLGTFLRLTPYRRGAGLAGVDVVKIIPFALPSAWGSCGLEIHPDATSLTRAPTQRRRTP